MIINKVNDSIEERFEERVLKIIVSFASNTFKMHLILCWKMPNTRGLKYSKRKVLIGGIIVCSSCTDTFYNAYTLCTWLQQSVYAAPQDGFGWSRFCNICLDTNHILVRKAKHISICSGNVSFIWSFVTLWSWLYYNFVGKKPRRRFID